MRMLREVILHIEIFIDNNRIIYTEGYRGVPLDLEVHQRILDYLYFLTRMLFMVVSDTILY